MYDASTMKKEHVLDAVSSVLSDFDVERNLLVTCGMSSRYVAFAVFSLFLFSQLSLSCVCQCVKHFLKLLNCKKLGLLSSRSRAMISCKLPMCLCIITRSRRNVMKFWLLPSRSRSHSGFESSNSIVCPVSLLSLKHGLLAVTCD